MDGILLINKPAGYTSHDIVGIVRKKLHTKKVGHCGTLDPDATCLLVVCVNKATKAIQFLMSDTKVYRATLSLGKSTDTYDASGKILEEKEVGQISQAQVIDVLNSFIEFIQRFRSEINDNTSVRRNERLLAIIDAGKNEILSNIDFIDRLPQMKFVRDEINKLSEKRLQLNTEIDRLKIQEERLQQNIEKENQEFESLKQDKENFREQELINKKTILEAEITELEERKNNLSSFVSVEEERLSKELATITDDIRWKQKSKQECKHKMKRQK